jgi:DNA-binding HxlR family transcriptional regulator
MAHEISDEQLDTLEETVATIRDNRPEDPETVSYALDDLEHQLQEIAQ